VKLNKAPRIAHGRCAALQETLLQLEVALKKVCTFEYTEEQVCDSLFWGACHVDCLGFPPMGKGTSSAACKASTLAETVEWLALRCRRELPGYQRASQDNITNALPIEKLLSHIASLTPELLTQIKQTEAAQQWVNGYSLTTERSVKIPLEYINAISGTNGIAAGNCLEEAIVQGAYELIERRAVITAIRNKIVFPTIDISTIDDPAIRSQIALLEAHGTEITLKDLSFGGALPSVGIYFINHQVPDHLQAHRVFKGAACYNRQQALSSCLTEYAQVCQIGRRNHKRIQEYEHLLCDDGDSDNFLPLFWFGYLPYREADFLKEGDCIAFDNGQLSDNCLVDINQLIELFGSLGLEMLAVDLTGPVLDFPVVQIIVPGYSDILPYHPSSSPVLLQGWTRDLPMGFCQENNQLKKCTAAELFPAW